MNQQDPNPSSRQGHEACPQLAAQSGEILLADGISKSISVTGVNLPAENKVSLSRCLIIQSFFTGFIQVLLVAYCSSVWLPTDSSVCLHLENNYNIAWLMITYRFLLYLSMVVVSGALSSFNSGKYAPNNAILANLAWMDNDRIPKIIIHITYKTFRMLYQFKGCVF